MCQEKCLQGIYAVILCKNYPSKGIRDWLEYKENKMYAMLVVMRNKKQLGKSHTFQVCCFITTIAHCLVLLFSEVEPIPNKMCMVNWCLSIHFSFSLL